MSRLDIKSVPRPFPHRVIRAPVPWRDQVEQSRNQISTHLFLTNPVITLIQNLWDNKYSDLKFISADKLDLTDFPIAPNKLLELVLVYPKLPL